MFACEVNTLFERKIQLSKDKCLENYWDFEFPPQSFKDKVFFDFKDLNDELIRIGLKIGFYRGRIFVRKELEKAASKKIVYTCRERTCQAKLSYVWTGQSRQITCESFDNIHFHKRSSANSEKQKREFIHEFIMDIPFSENWENFKKWIYRFNINEKDAKSIIDQLYWFNNTEDENFTKMSFEGKTVRRMKDSMGNTVCFFLATETMKKNYQLYGEVINFDTTYRMIKRLSPYGEKYAVSYFFAQDTDLRFVMTGVCFYVKDQKMLLKSCFEFYFDLVCEGVMPFVIFTDDIIPLNEAILEVKKERNYKFEHFHDWFHITSNLRETLGNEPKGPEAFKLFCKALGECHIDVYNHYITQIEPLLKDKSILQEFLAKDNKFCICKMPTVNLNFGIQYRYSRSLNQRINQCSLFETCVSRFFYTLFHLEAILLRGLEKVTVINQGRVKHVQTEEVHFLTNKLENKVFEQFFEYFQKSLDEDLILEKMRENDNKSYYIYSLKAENSDGPKPKYYLTYREKEQFWVCSCRMQFFNGLPCAHILKYLREKEPRTPYVEYINSRWLHNKADRIPDFSKPLITRKRRRP